MTSAIVTRSILKKISDVVTLGTFCYRDQTYINKRGGGRLVGWFGFNGPLRQYFSLYQAVSQREGERGKKG